MSEVRKWRQRRTFDHRQQTTRFTARGRPHQARITRRRFLKLTNASAIAARTGGLAAILALGRAPAHAQGITLHWLRWNDFVPASDDILRKQIAPECRKALGITLNIEMINANDMQARTTSSIQSGSGPTSFAL
jgi:multiple sugar transport system substrate-binding protein